MNRVTLILLLGLLLVAVGPAQGQTPTRAADYFDRGLEREKHGDYDGAIADFSQAIKLDSRDASAYYNRGLVRHMKEDIDGAISDYNKAIELNPRHRRAYFMRGILREFRDRDGALADYNRAIEVDSAYAPPYINRGVMRRAKNDLEGALSDYSRAIELEPRSDEAYSRRGSARKAKGDLEGAIADYQKAIEFKPDGPANYDTLAWLLATSFETTIRDGKKAVEYATRASELTNWENPSMLDTLAAAYAEAGNFAEAIKSESKALSFSEWTKNARVNARARLKLYQAGKPYREK